MVTMEEVRALRERTGAGVVEVKKALEESKGDVEGAIRILRERGAAKAVKKSEREAHEGVVAVYLHGNSKVGAMVRLFCETDFVARNDAFRDLGRDIAMHVTAMNPMVVSPDDIPADSVERERGIWTEELRRENKPAEMIERILVGKEKKYREENALLTQPFVKDQDRLVGDIINEKILQIGENIRVGGFVRYEL